MPLWSIRLRVCHWPLELRQQPYRRRQSSRPTIIEIVKSLSFHKDQDDHLVDIVVADTGVKHLVELVQQLDSLMGCALRSQFGETNNVTQEH